MYGLINKAIQGLVVAKHGEVAWQVIKGRAGVEIDTFFSLDAYPDELSYSLVEAASEVLDTSAAEVLEAVGQYWLLHTAEEGYGPMLASGGATVAEFLCSLDVFHARAAMAMPELRPPSFSVEPVSDTELVVSYYSERSGLTPMVIGLLKAVGRRFGQKVAVSHTVSKGDESDHDEFLVEILTPTRA